MSEQYVIGEGVILDARPSSFMSRGLTFALDAVVYLTLLFLSVMWLVHKEYLSEEYGAQLVMVTAVFFLVILPMTIETLTRGRTLGKLAGGLRVVRDDGGPVALRHSFIRAVVGILELWMTFGVIAVSAALFNNRGKRLGDMLAGTYVIRVRSKKMKEPELVTPPYLLAWIKNADIAKLPDGVSLAARQFLARRWQMSPQARISMGRQFRVELSQRVAPQPPFPVQDEEYILAVITERSQRESVLEAHRVNRAHAIQDQMESLPFGIGR